MVRKCMHPFCNIQAVCNEFQTLVLAGSLLHVLRPRTAALYAAKVQMQAIIHARVNISGLSRPVGWSRGGVVCARGSGVVGLKLSELAQQGSQLLPAAVAQQAATPMPSATERVGLVLWAEPLTHGSMARGSR